MAYKSTGPQFTRSDCFFGNGVSATQWLKHFHTIISGYEYTLKQYLEWLDLLLMDDAADYHSFTSLFYTRFESLIEFHSGVRDQPPQLPEQPIVPEQPITSEQPTLPEQPTVPQLSEPAPKLSEQPTLQLPEQPVVIQSAPSVPEQPAPSYQSLLHSYQSLLQSYQSSLPQSYQSSLCQSYHSQLHQYQSSLLQSYQSLPYSYRAARHITVSSISTTAAYSTVPSSLLHKYQSSLSYQRSLSYQSSLSTATKAYFAATEQLTTSLSSPVLPTPLDLAYHRLLATMLFVYDAFLLSTSFGAYFAMALLATLLV
ncbi:hypothetical protein HO173_001221 [Letharia columbiana]|uniref:Uncharacterized protein n=1 Tax=Letharia columbiana TaxID=112416 RepID=A0A8H6G4W1_9LECA|nr:uncharacterized protein HO173_001221 [Letharia columbiana]KAF6240552.1 hypothetical protein HO173_001221 [Letharia columbiana]